MWVVFFFGENCSKMFILIELTICRLFTIIFVRQEIQVCASLFIASLLPFGCASFTTSLFTYHTFSIDHFAMHKFNEFLIVSIVVISHSRSNFCSYKTDNFQTNISSCHHFLLCANLTTEILLNMHKKVCKNDRTKETSRERQKKRVFGSGNWEANQRSELMWIWFPRIVSTVFFFSVCLLTCHRFFSSLNLFGAILYPLTYEYWP